MTYSAVLFVCTLFFFVFYHSYAAPTFQLITSLPGLDISTLNFAQYSGYIQIDATTNRSLFYWFIESQRDPSTDPVVLWTNGGPGSSSLLGLFTENGPFRPYPNGSSLYLNPYSWNSVASILYVEDPCGVGFSFSSDSNDYITNDEQTASDNYLFLLGWFTLYPEFSTNDFYLSGESYAGHYIPQLAEKILELDTEHTLNMQGIILGNPYINLDAFIDWPTFFYMHAYIPVKAYWKAVEKCDFMSYFSNCADQGNLSASKSCVYAGVDTMKYIPLDNFDLYNLVAPTCHDSISHLNYVAAWNPLAAELVYLSCLINSQNTRKLNANKYARSEMDVVYDPCLEDYLPLYLNIPEVQTAIHANPTVWTIQSTSLQYDLHDFWINTVPLFETFISETDWRILIYSDGCVPFTSTQRWINCLNEDVVSDWRNWEVNSQNAGTIIEYDSISFVTVNGAGHMVPRDTPQRALYLFEHWLSDEEF